MAMPLQQDPGIPYTGEHLAACLEMYCRLWEVPLLQKRNPCAQPVSLERKHIPLIQRGDYVVADKSDGVRYTLFLCSCKGRHYSFLVDRKLSFYQIPVAAGKRAFAGSIFDGELVWATSSHPQKSQLFLVFDVVAFKGSPQVRKENLHKRLEVIRGAFDLNGVSVSSPSEAAALAKEGKIVCGGNAHGLSFRPKPCFPMDQIDTLLRQLPLLPYATDGLMFTPVQTPVAIGTAENTFKLKDVHTVDIEVKGTELLIGQGGPPETAVLRVNFSTAGIALKPSATFWAEIEAVRGDAVEMDSMIVECLVLLTDEGPKMDFIARRLDKAHPNTVRTVIATLLNLRENIQPHELCPEQRNMSSRHDEPDDMAAQLPKPFCCEVSSQGGAELANLAVGDVLDFQRFAGPFLTPTPA